MAIEYRTCPNDDNFLTYMNTLGKEHWIYCGEKGDKLVFYREVKRAISKKEIVDDIEFEEWYALYPKKESKHTALKAWHSLSIEDKEQTKQLSLHIRYWKSKYGIKFSKGKEVVKDTTYIPLPASWLNGKKWNDEIEIDGKSKDQLQQEQDMIKKRVEEQRIQAIEEEKSREEAEHISLIIRRLREYGQFDKLLEEARKQSPDGTMTSVLEFKARSIVKSNPSYWESIVTIS